MGDFWQTHDGMDALGRDLASRPGGGPPRITDDRSTPPTEPPLSVGMLVTLTLCPLIPLAAYLAAWMMGIDWITGR